MYIKNSCPVARFTQDWKREATLRRKRENRRRSRMEIRPITSYFRKLWYMWISVLTYIFPSWVPPMSTYRVISYHPVDHIFSIYFLSCQLFIYLIVYVDKAYWRSASVVLWEGTVTYHKIINANLPTLFPLFLVDLCTGCLFVPNHIWLRWKSWVNRWWCGRDSVCCGNWYLLKIILFYFLQFIPQVLCMWGENDEGFL